MASRPAFTIRATTSGRVNLPALAGEKFQAAVAEGGTVDEIVERLAAAKIAVNVDELTDLLR